MIVRNSLLFLIRIIDFLILIRVLISWIPVDRYNRIIQIIYTLTEPFLAPARALINRSSIGGRTMFDFSPIVVWLILDFIIRPLITYFVWI